MSLKGLEGLFVLKVMAQYPVLFLMIDIDKMCENLQPFFKINKKLHNHPMHIQQKL